MLQEVVADAAGKGSCVVPQQADAGIQRQRAGSGGERLDRGFALQRLAADPQAGQADRHQQDQVLGGEYAEVEAPACRPASAFSMENHSRFRCSSMMEVCLYSKSITSL